MSDDTPELRLSNDKAAVVDPTAFWISLIDQIPPRNAKVQLICKADGVAAYGTWTPDSHWTHWAALCVFRKD